MTFCEASDTGPSHAASQKEIKLIIWKVSAELISY